MPCERDHDPACCPHHIQLTAVIDVLRQEIARLQELAERRLVNYELCLAERNRDGGDPLPPSNYQRRLYGG